MKKTLLIARREYMAFVRTVGFWLSLITLPLLMLGSAFIPLMMSRSEAPQSVAVLDLSGLGLDAALEGYIRAQDPAESPLALPESVQNDAMARAVAENLANKSGLRLAALPAGLTPDMSLEAAEARISELMKAETPPVAHIIVAFVHKPGVQDGQLGFHLWSAGKRGKHIEDRLQWNLHELQFAYAARLKGIEAEAARELYGARAEIKSLTPALASAGPEDTEASWRETLKTNGPRVLGIILSYLTWMAIFSSSVILLTGVIEEKSSKVLEVLLTSASTGSLLVGKVLGVAFVMMTVAGVWAGVGSLAFGYGAAFLPSETVGGITQLMGDLFSPVQVALMLAYFLGGYLMYGVTFSAIGAFCETQKDAQAILGPIILVLMIPMLSLQAALISPDLPLIRYLSWVPLFTPFLMPLRLLQGVAWWEIAATLMGMWVLAYLMIRLGGRAFKQGALGGGRLSWRTLFSAMKS